MSDVLVVSPHPDDESLGCGGALRAHAVAGNRVEVVFLTSGEGIGRGGSPEEIRAMREREAETAAAILGLAQITFWRKPDGSVRVDQRLVGQLVELVETIRPALIYVTHGNEEHRDHRAAARLVRRALGRISAEVPRPEVRAFEIWTPLQRFDCVVDVSDHIDTKIEAVRAHRSQCEFVKLDEAVRGLARYHGEMHGWLGGPYAEVFRHG